MTHLNVCQKGNNSWKIITQTKYYTFFVGDCLYNAISRICSGDYSLSAELRLAVCIVLVICWDAIDADVRQKRQIALPKDNVYNTEHDETLTQILGRASRIGGYAGKFELSAISQVINGPINVLYPSPYGKKDKRIQK